MRIQILSTIWGETHKELFKKAALKSLSWPKNAKALQGAKWNIFADDEHHEELKALMPHGIQVDFRSTSSLRDYIDQVQSASIWQMNECLKHNEKLLLAPPDTIFADGSIENLLLLGEDPDTCVVVPHPRVLPKMLDDLEAPKSPAQLTSLSFKHLHKSWENAELNHPLQNSYIGGVEWRKLTDSLYAVTHRLPTVYLAHFTEEDLQYFKSAISFGNFDHRWPGDILIPRGRQRYCGSSESCFIVEVTEQGKNVPPTRPGDPTRGFWFDWPHNRANAQITAIWRGE